MPTENDSFNLTKGNRQKDNSSENIGSFTWQEHAYERLKVLYKVSKIFSTEDHLDKTFPEILSLCTSTFPFLTAIVIESRADKVNTIVWNASNASEEQIKLAVSNAKESFIYFTGANAAKSRELRKKKVQSEQLEGINTEQNSKASEIKNYCVVPLLVDRLPAFGILQLEGSLRLNEKDLEFIGALADLISVSLDRHQKTKFEKELRQREATLSTEKLSLSEGHVHDLEAERELRVKFVSLLTHDLRTPLSAIKMNAQLIQRHINKPKMVKSLAERIDKSVNRTDQMIGDLLDANRIRSGEKLPVKVELVNLVDLVKKTLDELAVIHGDRFILHSDKPIQGHWDIKGVRRIIENLCNNAIKHGFADSKVEVALSTSDTFAVIEVRNKGELISPEDQKNLFDQFQRGRNTSVKGWGIGLTLVRGVAEAHGGEVDIKSDIESGTCFTVSLPLDSRPFVAE